MKSLSNHLITVIVAFTLLTVACTENNPTTNNDPSLIVDSKKSDEAFVNTLEKHLKAVENRDLETLKSTLSPNGNMEFIQPSSETKKTVTEFVDFHVGWFALTNWTGKTKILTTNIGNKIGVATTELYYQEPDRNGKPYFNRLAVSYTLEKMNGTWYVIKDHASSIEKTKN